MVKLQRQSIANYCDYAVREEEYANLSRRISN
jgi:hypothetical protein